MRRRPMQTGSSVVQGRARVIRKSGRNSEGIKHTLDSLPRILCWQCRRLTSFELDRCEHCGSAFAGSTGGAYRTGHKSASKSPPASRLLPSSRSRRPTAEQPAIRPRSLQEIVEDLRRVRDLADSPREPPRDDGEVSLLLYQCPSCGRFVARAAEECACGVRFAADDRVTFQCPECGSSIPSDEDGCPVCRAEFRPSSLQDHLIYSCPRCGAQVDSEAVRCSCGVRFEA
jgi:predicted RNA-binding Zn-ribbon protein involved in translation (DUF1610 family)